MNAAEFVETVQSYGVSFPSAAVWGGNVGYWRERLELPETGSGKYRSYTARHVRLVVAHQLFSLFGGKRSRDGLSDQLRHEASFLMAETSGGWVAISERQVWWQYDPPVDALARGVLAIRVPEWTDA